MIGFFFSESRVRRQLTTDIKRLLPCGIASASYVGVCSVISIDEEELEALITAE